MTDWANPGSPNYERRNYYLHPETGMAIAREPGYYNPDNPYDTGRHAESNMEFFRTYGWRPELERRMDEPGVTPWGPGGKSSPPGAFAAAPRGAQAGGVQRLPASPFGADLAQALAGSRTSPAELDGLDYDSSDADPQTSLEELLAALLSGTRRRGHQSV